MTEKRRQPTQCRGVVDDYFGRRQCANTGRHEYDNKMYCKMHHPPTVEEKRLRREEIKHRDKVHPSLVTALYSCIVPPGAEFTAEHFTRWVHHNNSIARTAIKLAERKS